MLVVSIHAPTRGATCTANSDLPAEVVSIHAPTRGATFTDKQKRLDSNSFNPRTHTGCDKELFAYQAKKFWFQSTHPHGVRQYTTISTASLNGFQSTHPHGVRLTLFNRMKLTCKFQSTHPHGVRRNSAVPKATLMYVSIHAPTRGATRV